MIQERVFEAVVDTEVDTWKDYDRINKVMVDLTRNHISRKYPGSKHWDPDKVEPCQGEVGILVHIPGASRAYHDVDIYPRNVNYLTIPISNLARGHRAREFGGLFRPWKKGGKERANVLALKGINKYGKLTYMYALAKKAHQTQDQTLLPTDEDYAWAIFDEFENDYIEKLRNNLKEYI